MPTLAAKFPTLLDLANRVEQDGKIAQIVEMLGQTNEMLTDAVWQEANQDNGHLTTIRTGLPAVAWRLLNKGVPSSKSTTAQVLETCGMLETRSEVDIDLPAVQGANAFRLSEASPFLEAMNQEMQSTMLYGNATTAPEEFTGLTARYNALSGSPSAQNVISGTAAPVGSDQMSMWLIGWGPQTCFMTYPKGAEAGLKHWDLGEGDSFDSNGDRYRTLMDRWQWKCGLVLKDWRYAVRIPNIDSSVLVTDTTGATIPLLTLMIKAMHRIPSFGMGRFAFYANRTTAEFLDIQAQNKANLLLTSGMEEGVRKTTFRGIPIRTCDALLQTESIVT